MLKIYFNAVGIVVSAFIMMGLVIPYMVSSNSHELPLLGFGVLTLYIPLIYMWVKTVFKQIKDQFNNINFNETV